MTTLQAPDVAAQITDKVTVISVDTHVGPPLDVLREYCSPSFRDDFDAYKRDYESQPPDMYGFDISILREEYLNRIVETLDEPLRHYDPLVRLKEMDVDGVAGEVIYHGALNGNPIPFAKMVALGTGDALTADRRGAELAAEGLRIYNRWLADYCSVAPERRCGIAMLPFWDVELAVRDLEAARASGLGAVNLPSPRSGMLGYNNPIWEPLWSACAAMDVPLNSHGGAAVLDFPGMVGRNQGPLVAHETLYWARRVLWFMIFGGVFDFHPTLKLVLTEQPGGWIPQTLVELDAALENPVMGVHELAKRPSEYFQSNCYIGASFMSNSDVQVAVRHNFVDQVLWGSDYPHVEGTFPHSVVSLRMATAGIDDEDIRKLLGATAANVYGFDLEALRSVVDRIGPTLEQMHAPVRPEEIPTSFGSMGFRQGESWV